MLHLVSSTEDRWIARALSAMPEILLDHAHCEKKAASTALSLIFRYPEHPEIVAPLSELAREELSHFELVLGHLSSRGLPFRRQRPSPYAGRLMEIVRKAEPARFLDLMISCAFIEARSCERMKLLARALEESGDRIDRAPDLARLYKGLLVAEARHHRLFIDLLERTGAFAKDEIATRIDQVAAHEASVIASAPDDPRLHN